jgi:hypothetical protein
LFDIPNFDADDANDDDDDEDLEAELAALTGGSSGPKPKPKKCKSYYLSQYPGIGHFTNLTFFAEVHTSSSFRMKISNKFGMYFFRSQVNQKLL